MSPQTPAGNDTAPADIGEAPERVVRELAGIPAAEVISNAIILLMSAAAEKLGLADPDPASSENVDLDEARKLITALAGLVQAATPDLGLHGKPIRDGLRGLQEAFREASVFPDAPGEGPGEKLV
ncbi:MAG: DUF1844 domain-containing protein [Segniliparus sp.]|uniref:DUF1844 domain-containing protein n=1 Tax=Segniliparus sp. TaxID=2804064 RepID=UPI003F2BA4AE